MSENTVTLSADDKTAKALVRHEKSRNKIVYVDYIKAHNVTVETVGEHVKALRLMAYPKLPASDKTAKNFADRVRQGLRHHLGDSPEDRADSPVNLLTRAGLAAELADVVAAWKAAQDNN